MKTQKFIRCNPHLPVRDLRATLDYYRDKLGFTDEWTMTNSEGKVTDGGIRRDNMRLLFGEDPSFSDTISSYPGSRLPLMWFVEDIDAIFSEFQARGIPFADTLRAHAYGLCEFAFVDINGYYIRVAESN
ncbi:MAG TPA: VOC family protein [Mucilaginibacter sp.]|nr:VOC family protein [Mucilaginibacter sp.]